MKKWLFIMAVATLSSMAIAETEAERFGLQYVATPPGTNYKVYKGGEFMFIDARATGRFASISIPTIRQQQNAGYAIIPARNFDEMNQNGQFARGYSVNCGTDVVYDDNGKGSRASELNQLHQAAANLACLILDSE